MIHSRRSAGTYVTRTEISSKIWGGIRDPKATLKRGAGVPEGLAPPCFGEASPLEQSQGSLVVLEGVYLWFSDSLVRGVCVCFQNL